LDHDGTGLSCYEGLHTLQVIETGVAEPLGERVEVLVVLVLPCSCHRPIGPSMEGVGHGYDLGPDGSALVPEFSGKLQGSLIGLCPTIAEEDLLHLCQ